MSNEPLNDIQVKKVFRYLIKVFNPMVNEKDIPEMIKHLSSNAKVNLMAHAQIIVKLVLEDSE